MAFFYTKNWSASLLACCFCILPLLATAFNNGGPGNPAHPDSLAGRGHCMAVIELDTLCTTGEITISAYVYWTFTGVHQPVVASWSSGQVAHKITVLPPGTWSWDPTGTTCEEYHWDSEVTFQLPFFEGPVELSAPTAICPNEAYVEIQSNLNYYSHFEQLTWSPANPAGDFEPFPASQGGTYGITVTDAFGCTSSDQVTIVDVPIFTPVVTGPVRLCPEGDTSTVSIVNPGLYASFSWENGETVSPIDITGPGIYAVTATDSHGCTGTGSHSVQSGEVSPFSVSVSSPSLCPGQLDTLRVLGGFAEYLWSNNTTGITNVVNQAGTYTVTVTNFFGCTGTTSTTIVPLSAPAIQLSGTPLCPGDTTILSVSGGNFPQYQWSSGQNTPSIEAVQPGTYTVTVSGAGICATSTQLVLPFAAVPNAEIALPSALNCVADVVLLDGNGSNNGPNYPFFWTTPDGHFVSGDSTLTPVVDAPGLYVLHIRNDTTGCLSRDSVTVLQDLTPPPADAGTPATLSCTVQTLDIGPIPTPTDPNLLPSWSTPNGNILSGNDTWTPQVDAPGHYVLTVTHAGNGCSNTASVVIPQDLTAPTVSIAPSDLLTCMQGTVPLDGSGSSSGATFQYLWTTTNGTLVGPVDTLVSGASSVGTYNLLITNTLNGCTATSSILVSADVNIPIVTALVPDTLNCATATTFIDATASSTGPGFQYEWSTSNGHILEGGNTLLPTVDAPGLYTLHLLNTDNNCTATLAVTVGQDIVLPVADAGQSQTLSCSSPATLLDGSASSVGPNLSYEWSTLDGNIVSGEQTVQPTVNLDGTYILQVTDASNGCSTTASVLILNDANAPTALISPTETLTCNTLQTQIDATASSQTPNLTYTWSGNILAGQGTLQPTVNEPGVYTLSITDTSNGCTDVASVTVGQDISSPVALAGADVLLNCFGPAGILGNGANPSGTGFALEWTTVDGHFTSSTNNATATIDQAGTYQLLITNTQNGCTAVDDVAVVADFALPAVDAGPGGELTCAQISLSLQGSGSMGAMMAYGWSTANGNIASGAQTLSPVVDAPGLYNLLITNTQNGCTASSQVAITENADGPVAVAGLPQTLNCTLTGTNLNATESSTGIEFSYAWSTPNGNITAGANSLSPHIDAPGTYLLTVTNTDNLCTATSSVTIVENVQLPELNILPPASLTCVLGALDLQIQVVSSSSQNLGYQWSTNDGQITVGANSASPTIDAAGSYALVVTDMANGCTGVAQVAVWEDTVLPTALAAAPQTLTCVAQQVFLPTTGSSMGPNFAYEWSTLMGHFVSLQNPQLPSVDAPGVYQLTISNLTNGCTQSVSVNVLQNVELPIVEAGVGLVLDCDTPTGTLSSAGSSTGPNFHYTWTSLNGEILQGANGPSPSVGEPGDYVLTIVNTENGCISADNVQVTQDITLPALLVAPPQTLTCVLLSTVLSGSGTGVGNMPAITWSTSSSGHIVAGGNTLSPTVDAPGTYFLTVQNTTNACSATVSVNVLADVQAPSVQVQTPPLLTCSVLELDLQSTVSAQASIAWNTSDGHIVSGASTLSPTVNAPGTYEMLATSVGNGCTDTTQIEVRQELNVPESLIFSMQAPLCNGTPGNIRVQDVNGGVGPFAYSVDGGQTFFASDSFANLASGTYDLVIQDANGCEITQNVLVPAPPLPLVTAPLSFEIALGQNQEIQAIVPPSFPMSLVDTVIWTPMQGLTFAGNSVLELLRPVAAPLATTQYTVTIVTAEGCRAEARTLLRVDRQVDIYAPNVIWPDDPDSNNATFLLFSRDESVANIHYLQVFDRWGSLVFANKDLRPNDFSAGWDGFSRGEPVNPGVFVWWAEVELADGRLLTVKGDVTVLR